MNDNSQQILNDVLAQQRQEFVPEVSDQDYFEIFCAEQILKDFDLSYDEIESGIVDGEHDGGVDSVYAFVNGELIYEDFDTSPFKKDVQIELHIIQSKTSGGFSEVPLNKLISVTRHLLKLDADYDALPQYNSAVKNSVDNFRSIYRKLASKFPTLKICYYYASKKADSSIHDNLQLKANELKEAGLALFPEAYVEVEFLGARKLLELARRRPKTTYELKVRKSLSGENGYIILASLGDYNKFLRGVDGKVKTQLFESNVRDFQGSTPVNDEIGNTLRDEKIVDFWWMNNGVTILASRATLNGDLITVENPQIVNGLQTSTQIARHFGGAEGEDARNVMVKIVSSENEETRDKIIKATNSQNGIQPSTLRATDKIQRDIEETLKVSGLFYDRRKNFYKNEGKPADKIISIPLMAQAVMSMILSKPDTARARPSSLIKENSVYSQVFSEAYPISLYLYAATMIRTVDRVLKNRSELTARDRTNLRFYVLLWLSSALTGKSSPKAHDIANIKVTDINDSAVEAATDEVWKVYEEMSSSGSSDQLAKGPDLRKQLMEKIAEKFQSSKVG
ncbi:MULTISPECIES: AIPR family protein [Asticcacaulis]|uniref:AIPR family protein n=1 Tax=Asticcacaulis TaxID=76890 RepID=UPI001AE79644|nr:MULTISPECIES: AIPR family protein [Asticcacaulis]MBP2161665.1 hypothetical protein [Asticcacaulis solisilvae]MDR6802710.1 hypothetical protein [Asticcacaulis sp. BE141]